jgi:hypothetical protein
MGPHDRILGQFHWPTGSANVAAVGNRDIPVRQLYTDADFDCTHARQCDITIAEDDQDLSKAVAIADRYGRTEHITTCMEDDLMSSEDGNDVPVYFGKVIAGKVREVRGMSKGYTDASIAKGERPLGTQMLFVVRGTTDRTTARYWFQRSTDCAPF